MKILLMMVVVQSLNLVVFAWLDRAAFMRVFADHDGQEQRYIARSGNSPQ